MSPRMACTIEKDGVARFHEEMEIELRVLTIAFIQASGMIMAPCLTNYHYARPMKIGWIPSTLGDMALL